jgi:hypothetical protein
MVELIVAYSRQKIFRAGDEQINLLLAPMLALVCFVVLFKFPVLNKTQMVSARFLVFFIGMNIVHTGITYFLLKDMPAFRKYMEDTATPWMQSRVLVGMTVALITLMFWIFSGRFSPDSLAAVSLKFVPQKFIIGALKFWSMAHVIRQTMGLSMLYNISLKGDQLNELEVQRLNKLVRWEKWAFHGLCLSLFIRIFFKSIAPSVFFVFELSCCLVIIGVSFASPKWRKSNKTLYAFRCLLYPFGIVHFIFNFASMIIHGVEYFFLTRRLLDNGNLNRQVSNQILVYGLGLGTAILLPQFVMQLNPSLEHQLFGRNAPLWILVVLAIAKAINLMHFYIDGFIFRFRDPAVRENILPILADRGQVSLWRHSRININPEERSELPKRFTL